MKILDRLGLALFSMLILVISIVLILIGFGFVDASIFSILVGKALISQEGTYIMIGVSVVLVLLSLRCLFFGQDSMEGSEEGIMLQNNDGKLLITKTTLENLVEGVVAEFPSIDNAETNVKFDKDSNIIISIVIDVKDGTVIKELSSKLQSRVKKGIKDATNLELESVDIEIQNVNSKDTTKEEEKQNSKEGN